jgi:hypothetical protein
MGAQTAAQCTLIFIQIAWGAFFAYTQLFQGGPSGLFGHWACFTNGTVKLVAECFIEWLHANFLIVPTKHFLQNYLANAFLMRVSISLRIRQRLMLILMRNVLAYALRYS